MPPLNNHQDVFDFFQNKAVLITGATGFLGKAILEKLLRSCGVGSSGVIYLLMRELKHATVEKRLEELRESEIFDTLRAGCTNFNDWFAATVRPVKGDIQVDGLGLALDDHVTLIKAVNVIIHAAADTSFENGLRQAVQINAQSSLNVLQFAKECSDLHSMMHVSTINVNSNRPSHSSVKEELYIDPTAPSSFSAEDELSSILALDDAELERLSPTFLRGRPNTYTYAKYLCEHLMASRAAKHGIPLLISRPSMVGAALREPVPGWIDSKLAIGGGLLAVGSGVKSLWLCNAQGVGDIMPVDLTVNAILVAIARRPQLLASLQGRCGAASETLQYAECVPVVNIGSSGSDNPVTWDTVFESAVAYFRKVPLSFQMLTPSAQLTSSRLYFRLADTLALRLPLSIIRVIAAVPMLGPTVGKILKMLGKRAKFCSRLDSLFGHFLVNSWKFENTTTTTVLLQSAAEDVDRKEARGQSEHLSPTSSMDWKGPPEHTLNRSLEIDVRDVNWAGYIPLFCYGLQRYALREYGDDHRAKAAAHGLQVDRLARGALRGLDSELCQLPFHSKSSNGGPVSVIAVALLSAVAFYSNHP